MSTTQIFFTEHIIKRIHCIGLSPLFVFPSCFPLFLFEFSFFAHLRAGWRVVPVNAQCSAYTRSAAENGMVSASSLQLCNPHGVPIFSSPHKKWWFWGLRTAAVATRYTTPLLPLCIFWRCRDGECERIEALQHCSFTIIIMLVYSVSSLYFSIFDSICRFAAGGGGHDCALARDPPCKGTALRLFLT